MSSIAILEPAITGIGSAKSILYNTPLPLKTDSYSPVPHKSVIEMTLEQIDKAGLKVNTERYTVAKDGKQALGFYHIEGFGDSEMGLELAWNNSYDKSMSLKWAIGGKVFICTNGCVSGDIGAFKRKHTGSVLDEYTEAVKRYIGDAEMHFEKLLSDKELLKEITVSKRSAAEMIGRMYVEKDIVTSTQLNIIKRELIKPSYDYKAPGSMWELYNHCTVALKEAHPLHNMRQHMDVHNFFTKENKIWN